MTNPKARTFVDDRESCTVQEAVAKLIGWMRGKTRLSVIRMNGDGGLIAEDLPFLHSLEGTVQDMLDGQWQAAQRERRRVEEGSEAIELVIEKMEALLDVEELMQRAATYLTDIEGEIVQGASSRLTLDASAKAEKGGIHITLKSLEHWALEKYGISIGEVMASGAGAIPERKETISRQMLRDGWLSPTLTEHLYTTLAFLVDAFADSRSIYRSKTGKLLVSNVAIELAEMAKSANMDIYLAGQSEEAIKTRIEKALGSRRSKLPGRKNQ